jgi:hypothetical protein
LLLPSSFLPPNHGHQVVGLLSVAHFGNAFEANLGLILGRVGLGRSLEDQFGIGFGRGRFENRFGADFESADLG